MDPVLGLLWLQTIASPIDMKSVRVGFASLHLVGAAAGKAVQLKSS